MATLTEILMNEQTRPQVEADCAALIEREVAAKGFAIKAAFKTVKMFKRDIVPDAVSHLLPEFVEKMEPFYAEHLAAGGGDLRAFSVTNAERIADALLSITDARAENSKHKTLVKAYRSLRPKGREQVIQAMPGVGDVLVKNGA
ncbi:MAG: hypothetical protein KC549_12645 [Myxococcales bacterium]|nr:hypothetical protein [Myxococcales bacterium]MCB9549568.1 hypothetical protein [Myxococcales bacterium]